MALHKFRDKGGFLSVFDDENGDYMRSGILDEQGQDTGIDPFQAEFPQLLDIGVMGHCEHGLSGLCEACGIECYQNGGTVRQPNMPIRDFEEIIRQCEGRTFQVALGGRGDPECHEDFAELLSVCRKYGIVPNMTTSGYGLQDAHVEIMKKYAGAVAVSWYKTPYTYRAVQKLVDAGITTNLHFVLGSNNIEEAIELLQDRNFMPGISRIVFLLHKPVGLGSRDRVLQADDPGIRKFFSLLSEPHNIERLGFDSCLVPGIAAHCPAIPPESYDACEAGRFSAYIGPDLMMCPCSFDKSDLYSESLYEKSVSAIWNGERFSKFRTIFENRCSHCSFEAQCLGGCPIKPEIRLCGQTQRRNEV